MRSHAIIAAIAFVGVALAAAALAAPPRVALVIGNSAYRNTPLANPANDARLMTETLRGLGFEVIEQIDADQQAMKYAIVEFGDRLEEAGTDAVGLFYYAGHGLQVNGENFLVPLGAEIEREKHVAIEAVSATWVLTQMEYAGNRTNFVILDACRNNPLVRRFRSPARGLARMDAPRGSLIAYSTAPGNVARDGEGANSPYSSALVREMLRPGVLVEQMFKQVRVAVMGETKDQQVPWEASSLTGNFYFNPGPSAGATAATTPAPADTEATERLFWESIQDSTDPADFKAYLAEYPNGTFATLARNRHKKLQKTQTMANVPPPETSIVVEEPTEIVIRADDDWVNSGITVERSKTYRITASGQWRMARFCSWTDADGIGLKIGLFCFSIGGEPVSDANFQTLIARVGSAGRPFAVGKLLIFVAESDGELYFRSNGSSGVLWDNEGIVRVTVLAR